jgi:hypothetical protein
MLVITVSFTILERKSMLKAMTFFCLLMERVQQGSWSRGWGVCSVSAEVIAIEVRLSPIRGVSSV